MTAKIKFAVATTLVVIAGSALALGADHRIRKRGARQVLDRERWKAVTVMGQLGEISPGEYPAPLVEIADLVDVLVSTAPDGESTEIRVRIKNTPTAEDGIRNRTGLDPDSVIRAALRDSKQLIEAGEVLRVLPRPEGRRSASPGGLLVDLAERRAKGKGVL
jgi:hypothetical protein